DKELFLRLINKSEKRYFKFRNISTQQEKQPTKTSLGSFDTYKEAYHQLMIELVELQVESIKSLLEKSEIKEIYIDGGFSENDVFINMLDYYFPNFNVFFKNYPNGAALGALRAILN